MASLPDKIPGVPDDLQDFARRKMSGEGDGPEPFAQAGMVRPGYGTGWQPSIRRIFKDCFIAKIVANDGDGGYHFEEQIDTSGHMAQFIDGRKHVCKEVNSNAAVSVGTYVLMKTIELDVISYWFEYAAFAGTGYTYTADEKWLHLVGAQFRHGGPIDPNTYGEDTYLSFVNDLANGTTLTPEDTSWIGGLSTNPESPYGLNVGVRYLSVGNLNKVATTYELRSGNYDAYDLRWTVRQVVADRRGHTQQVTALTEYTLAKIPQKFIVKITPIDGSGGTKTVYWSDDTVTTFT